MADNEKTAWTKIHVTQPIDELFKHGPTVEVGIRASRDLIVQALIDTGSPITVISQSLANCLNLNPTGKGDFREVGRESISADCFDLKLFWPGTGVGFELNVACLPIREPPHDLLIGRDILAICRLAIDFTTGIVGLEIRNP